MRPTVPAARLAPLPAPLSALPGCSGAGQPLFHCRVASETADLCLPGGLRARDLNPLYEAKAATGRGRGAAGFTWRGG